MRRADDQLARRRARLLARINRTYQTVNDVIAVGPLRVPFTKVKDADRVLDMVAIEADRRERRTGVREDDVQHLPYWAELWDSAYGVAQRTVERSASWGLNRRRVLDLGCGMGLTGAVAATVGADVVLADLEPAALLFAQLNTLHHPRARTRQLNWQTDRLDEQFDLILGADILYDKTQWQHLEFFWRHHLAPAGTVMLGEPGRQTGDLFIDWLLPRQWSLSRVEQKVATREKPIRIFELTQHKD